MGLLDRLRRRGGTDGAGEESGADLPVALDVAARRAQLQQLEQACDALAAAMRAQSELLDAPGWRQRINEYARAAGAAMQLRRDGFDREQLLDLSFEVRPVFSGGAPAGLEPLVGLQDEVVRCAYALGELLPGERRS